MLYDPRGHKNQKGEVFLLRAEVPFCVGKSRTQMGFGWRTCDQLKREIVQCSGTSSWQHQDSTRQSQAAQGRVAGTVGIGMPSASCSTPKAGALLPSPGSAVLMSP